MNHAQPKQYSASTLRAVSSPDAIEWEELPSLVGSLAQRLVQRGSLDGGASSRGANDSAFMSAPRNFGSPWDATMPAAFDPAPQSGPFHEPLEGVSTREVIEPDVFRHFFGPGSTF